MNELVKINVDENFSMSFLTANVIYKAGGKNGWDALALYIRYIQQSKWQRTNQPYCNDAYMIKWLWRSRNTFYKVKKILTDLGLIETIRDNLNDKTYVKIFYLVSWAKTKALIEEELTSPFYDEMNKRCIENVDTEKEEIKEEPTIEGKRCIENDNSSTKNWYSCTKIWDSSIKIWDSSTKFWDTKFWDTKKWTQMLKVNKINAWNILDKCSPEVSSETPAEEWTNDTKLSTDILFNDWSIDYYTKLALQQSSLDKLVEVLRPLYPHPRWYKGSKKDTVKAFKGKQLNYDYIYRLIYDMKLLWFMCEYNIVRWPWFMSQRVDTYVPSTEKQRDEDLTRIVTYVKRNNQDKELFKKRATDIVNLCWYDKYRKIFRSIPANREDTVDLSQIS